MNASSANHPGDDEAEPGFHIRREAGLVEAWATRRLPFEPKGWLKTFRRELAVGVRELVPPAPVLLDATYCSEDRSFCDAENILVYNVGPGAFAHVLGGGIRIERGYRVPACPVPLAAPACHYHRYGFVNPGACFRHWTIDRELVSWSATWPPDAGSSAGAYWRLVRRGNINTFGTPIGDETAFGLIIDLAPPAPTDLRLATVIKPLLDGVIAAFHADDGTTGDQPALRLSASLSEDPATITAWLADRDGAVLGTRRLLWTWGNGVQWNPADDRCVAVILRRIDSSDSEGIIHGRLVSVSLGSVTGS